MSSLKEMRDELRSLRKEASKPVSKLRKADISAEIERLKYHRESTPAPAATPSAPMKKSVAAVESIKQAKEQEFPHKPETVGQKKSSGRTTAAGKCAVAVSADGSKKKAMMAKMMKMLMDESDSE